MLLFIQIDYLLLKFKACLVGSCSGPTINKGGHSVTLTSNYRRQSFCKAVRALADCPSTASTNRFKMDLMLRSALRCPDLQLV